MTPAGGRRALAGSQGLGAALPLQRRRRRQRRLPAHGGARDLESRRGGALLLLHDNVTLIHIVVANVAVNIFGGQRRPERVASVRGGVREADRRGRVPPLADHPVALRDHGRAAIVAVRERRPGSRRRGRRDLLDRGGVVNLVLGVAVLVGRFLRGGLDRGPAEPGVAGAGAAEEGDDLLELGDGVVGDGPAVSLQVQRRGVEGLLRGRVLFLRVREELDELADALEARGGLLHRGLLHHG